jgi:hypothetical protein
MMGEIFAVGRTVFVGARYIVPLRQFHFKLTINLIVITLFGFLLQSVSAQTATPAIDAERSDLVTAYFSTSNDSPQIGEPFRLTLTIEVPAGVELVTFPTLPEDMLPLKILVAHDMTVQGRTYTQTYTAVMWGAGRYITPEIPVALLYQGAQVNNPVHSTTIDVVSEIIDPQGELTPRPSRPTRDVPYVSPLWIAGAVIAVLIILVLVRRFVRRESHRVAAPRIGTPAQIALAQLEDLKVQKIAPDVLYPLVADHLRTYLQSRSGITITDLTTQEIMSALKAQTSLPEPSRRLLEQILEQADLVKFARFAPDETQGTRYINAAIRWLREAETGWAE